MEEYEAINILLVDDRPENLLALEAIIEHDDYNLIKASSGEEALKFLLKYDFAAILLDVQMPGMDGIRTAKIIKAREKTKHIPILFITANHMESEYIFMGYSVGAIDYILKPFDPFVLKSKVEGFVNLYKLQQQLKNQAKSLEEKNSQLEDSNKELLKLTSELRKSEGIANVIRNTSIDSMVLVDHEGFILQVNPAVHEMFLYDEEAVIGKPLSILFQEDVMGHFDHDNHNMRGQITAIRSDGSIFLSEIQFGKQNIDGNIIVACTIRDISERKKHEEMTTFMAYHDPLTELPNVRYFNNQLVNQITEAKLDNQTFGIMYLDLDRFKFINDSLGHLVGDKLLIEVSKRLTEKIGEGNLLSRIGGDEFSIILPNTSREEALQLAEQLLQEFKPAFHINQYELFVTASIGLSVFPYDGVDSVELIKNADMALYRAKKLGKDRFQFYHAGLNMQSYRNFTMQNDLRKALSKNELSINYQPRINVQTGKVESLQSELIWNHPNWGTILTKEFLPLAEETGVIVEIWLWYFRRICEQLVDWNNKGFQNVKVGLLFSTQQFLQKDLISTIQKIMEETHVNPSQIEIGILEKTVIDYEDVIVTMVDQLKEIGIRSVIQNYGLGHLSERYISQFPVKGIGIGETFLTALLNNEISASLYKTSLNSIVKDLQFKVHAMNVTSVKQLSILKELGCSEVSGSLFSSPLTEKEVEEVLTNNTTFHNVLESVSYQLAELSATQESIQTDDSPNTDGNEKQNILSDALLRTQKQFLISTREMDVFELILDGMGNKEIADELFISEHTVKNHITRIFNKLGVNDRVQAIAIVHQMFNVENEKGEHI